MDKTIKLYRYVDGGINDTPFPNSENQIEISAFRYNATRMGAAPTITATIMFPSCLDKEWTRAGKVYAKFNNERFYLKQTPTSSYDNEDYRYKHSAEFVSERVILDNVYFYDAVKPGASQVDDKPVSNGTKFVFWGDIYEFADRLKASLAFSNLDYDVVVDTGVESEEKMVSFEDTFFSNAIQEAYNTYEVPYYFVGRTIHFGVSNNVLPTPLRYGVDNQLVSITKTNKNLKVVNRVTGRGSTENIPYYYPNSSPKGNIEAIASGNFRVRIVDQELFANNIALDGVITKTNSSYENAKVTFLGEEIYSGGTSSAQMGYGGTNKVFGISFTSNEVGVFLLSFSSSIVKYTLNGEEKTDADFGIRYYISVNDKTGRKNVYKSSGAISVIKDFEIPVPFANHEYSITIECYYAPEGKYYGKGGNIVFDARYSFGAKSGWVYKDKAIELKDIGLVVEGNVPSGGTITQKLKKYVNTSQNLMPSIYRKTDGAERFYNAVNGRYDGFSFINPFIEGQPREHIVNFEDIKPTIEGVKNDLGQQVDMFAEFAYDEPDSDETYEDTNDNSNVKYKHSYFFAKLRRLPFNLFDHAIENQPMTISFTSGSCGACKFKIGVTEEYPQRNPVQVNPDGTLKRDEQGRVICGVHGDAKEFQPSQQDTTLGEVWIALMKEDETYGIVMPKAPKYDENGKLLESGFRPETTDTFVITGIHLPEEYITAAEKRLEEKLLEYMADNNREKFSFAVKFSRIYFEENKKILDTLNENSQIDVVYDKDDNGDDIVYTQYVKSFSYSISEGEILPDITIELDENLTVGQNAIQNAISEVRSEIRSVEKSTQAAVMMQTQSYIQKKTDDTALGEINFEKGARFGENGKLEVLDDKTAKLTIDYLEVTKKATFSSLEIQEKTHAGGQILLTPAAINCNRVEELDDVYRCYFQTKGEDGDEIFNQFAVGDQAICQTFNTWGSKYYWRLVVGTGEDYIDLSKADCDKESNAPEAGDKIIQLGNREDESRQNAIVIAAHGDGSPYIIQYKGINSFEMSNEKIVTKLSSTENIFTGVVNISAGSTGFENIGLDVNIGGQNMLRNSGFTGDYLSEPLANDSVLDAASEMYGGKLQHWTTPDTNKVVELKDISASGYGVILGGGMLTQELYHSIIAGESYVFSMKAKSDMTLVEGQHNVTVSCGGITNNISVSNEWSKYVIKFVANISGSIFQISGIDTTICELQLERGTIETAWSMSLLDNSSDRAYYLSLDHLGNAMNASTTIAGGLVLANTIQVGNYKDKVMIEDTGGMSGSYTKKEDPFIWGGGSLLDAIDAINSNGANGANFVVTHGGKAILNEAVVKGTIYASDGEFTGKVNAREGTFKGNVSAQYGNVGCMDIGDDNVAVDYNTSSLRNHSSIRSNYGIAFHSKDKSDNTEVNCSFGYRTVASSSSTYDLEGNLISDSPLVQYRPGLCVEVDSKRSTPYDYLNAIYVSMTGAKENNAIRVASGDIKIDNGRVCGLRPNSRVVTSNNSITLTEYDHTIVFNVASGTVHVYLPSSPKDGQEYDIYTCHAAMDITIHTQGGINMYDFINAKDHTEASYTADRRRHIHIFYAGGQWWENYRYLQS